MEFGFLEQPVFNVERFLQRQRHISRNRFGATHDVDGIDIKLRRYTGSLFVFGKVNIPTPGQMNDYGIGIPVRPDCSDVYGFRNTPYTSSGKLQTGEPVFLAYRFYIRQIGFCAKIQYQREILVRRKWSGQLVPRVAQADRGLGVDELQYAIMASVK